MYICLYIDIDTVIVTHTHSPVSVIGSTTEYTITCDVTVSCTGLCSDTITISRSLNGNSINSTTLTIHHSLYQVVILLLVHLLQWEIQVYHMLDSINVLLV